MDGMMMMYLTRRSVFMGNPVLVPAGSKTLEQLGMPRLLTQPGRVFDHDVLEIHHAVPVRRMRGFDQPEQRYELTHFTTQAGEPIIMWIWQRRKDRWLPLAALTAGY